MANPTGKNGREQKPWADAIKRALARAENDPVAGHRTINKLAEQLLSKAAEGDMPALKELGDRLDGKPIQSIDADIRGTLTGILAGMGSGPSNDPKVA